MYFFPRSAYSQFNPPVYMLLFGTGRNGVDPFVGSLSDARIYSRVLTDREILTIAELGTVSGIPLLYFRTMFEESAASSPTTVVLDSSPFRRTGSLWFASTTPASYCSMCFYSETGKEYASLLLMLFLLFFLLVCFFSFLLPMLLLMNG
jgi:hypothetical protein